MPTDTDHTQLNQMVTFEFDTAEISCKVSWIDNDADYTINFFNPHTGFTNSSDPSSIQQGWSYQDPEHNINMAHLINYIRQWEDWPESISWENDAEDTFTLTWDGSSYTNDIMYWDNNDAPIYYKELNLMK